MKSLFCLLFSVTGFVSVFAQTSIHQEQSEYYGGLGIPAEDYYQLNEPAAMVKSTRAGCTPNKVVFGWHPYWGNGLEVNYDWSLLTDFSYFSYEVDANTGNALSTHGWATNTAVTEALNQGIRVNLCVTLFSNHSTFFGNPTAEQTLITNLINMVQSRGAHGVNIDFEGIPLSQKANFTAFMIDLCNQMHAAIPGSQVSTVLYAVDWNNVIDVAALNSYVDLFVIMGYAYYYNGSGTAGPCDPLFHFGSSYNYTLSKSVSTYLDNGVSPEKLILGLPYYGYEWPTTSLAVPSSTTGSGVSVTYKQIQNNSSGYYSSANRGWDADSYTRYYTFNNGTENRQAFIVSKSDFAQRLKVINRFDIGGMGIWALSYDDGYSDLWDEIYDKFTDCGTYTPCADTIFDMGGPNKSYYHNEDYTFTLAPDGASSITVNFTQFDVESNYDYLYIYNGPDVTAPQITGSPFTGTSSPGSFTSANGALTFRFTSDGATVTPGWTATYQCTIDNIAPTTQVQPVLNWQTQDFTAAFTDTDNSGGSGVNETFYSAIYSDGTEWRANAANGFFSDNFDNAAIHSDWTPFTGTWGISGGYLTQTDEGSGNTNMYAAVNQNQADAYLYHFAGAIDGSGANRRAGFHFMVDSPTLTNRGNGYFVWYRLDSDKIQIYEVISDVFSLVQEADYDFVAGTWYDFKTIYNRNTGKICVYINDVFSASWTDNTPVTAGDYISLRSGNAVWNVDNIKVYKSRTNTAPITVGPGADFALENINPATPAGKIKSLITDNAMNISTESQETVHVDFSEPSAPGYVNDGAGADIDIIYDNTTITANWTAALDTHSDISEYLYAIGTTPGGTDIVNYTSAALNTTITHSGLSLNTGVTYYFSVAAVNGAGLIGSIANSDGALLDIPVNTPVAGFTAQSTTICQGDSVQFLNTSSDAVLFIWNFQSGTPANSALTNPMVVFPASGTYSVQLIASGPGGTDTLNQTVSVTVNTPPVAAFTASDTLVGLPSAIVSFANTSTSSSGYLWLFGDGTSSTSYNPSHQYTSTGVFPVMLIAQTPGCAADTAFTTIYVGVTNLTDNNSQWLTVYPNPTHNQVTIQSHLPIKMIELVDLAGKSFSKLKTNGYSSVLDLTNLSSGSYLIKVSLSSGEVILKHIVRL
jgi:spore germination protein YaaH/PKD repeat protein